MAEHMFLFPSPVKKKHRPFTNYSKCIICQKDNYEDVLNNIQPDSFKGISQIIETHPDEVSIRLEPEIQCQQSFFKQIPKWHRKCRSRWTTQWNADSQFLTESSESSETFTRASIKSFDYKTKCVICDHEKLTGKHRHEKLRNVEYGSMPQTLYNKALELGDTDILFRIQDDVGKSVDMWAYEIKYHKTCYDRYRCKQSLVSQTKSDPYTLAFEKLLSEIEEPLELGKVFRVSVLRDFYRLHLKTFNLDDDRASQYRTSSLKIRLQKHFGADILFIPQRGALSEIVCRANITAAKLVQSLGEMQKNIEEHYIPVIDDNTGLESTETSNDISEDVKSIYRLACKIRSEMKEMHDNFKQEQAENWNVSYEQVLQIVPPSLYNLTAFLLSDIANFDNLNSDGRVILQDDKGSFSKLDTHERVLNLVQNILFSSVGLRTPQHVSLAIYVYHKTKSKDLITVLNRLGLCISYTDLQRILTTVACDVVQETKDGKEYIPPNIIPGQFVQYAIDNLDFQECTLDGSSMHVTSMVMYQSEGDINTELLKGGSMCAVPIKIKRRSGLSPIRPDLQLTGRIKTLKRTMHSGSRPNLDWLLKQSENSDSYNLNRSLVMARICPTKLLEVDIDCPTWKVFYASIEQRGRPITKIGYCPFLNSPPTDPNVVREALYLCMKASRQLGQEYTVVTQDEAVYEISYTLRRQCPEMFSNVILRLGGFHLLMNYLGAVGKIMAATGLKDLFVEGKLLLDGTANKVLNGKSYYQGLNAHLRVYEVLQELLWNAFEEWCINVKKETINIRHLEPYIEQLGNALEDGHGDTAHKVLTQLVKFFPRVNDLNDEFQRSREEYPTHQLWMQYIGMVDALLQFIHAERAAIWSEHLSASSKMAIFIAAADHNKYVKAIVSYLEEMRNLPQTAPDVQLEFEKGNFTVKRCSGEFNCVWTDMALECSQNCDAKGRSGQAGLKGVTMKPSAREKWFLTLPFTASVSSALKSMVHTDNAETLHHEDNQATKRRENKSRNYLIHLFSNQEITNPFTYNQTRDLINISSGLKATNEIQKDLLSVQEKGRRALQEYIDMEKFIKVGLHTFEELEKTKPIDKSKQRRKELTTEMTVLKRTLLDDDLGNMTPKFKKLMQYELSEHPPSISEVDARTQKIVLRQGNKATLLGFLKARVGYEQWPVDIAESNVKTGIVVDAMGFIHTNKPSPRECSEHFAARLLTHLVKSTICTEMHVIADRYDGIHTLSNTDGTPVCLKEASGCRDHRKASQKEYQISEAQDISKNWEDILQNSESKANLIRFLFKIWSESQSKLPQGLKLTLAGGFEGREEVRSLTHEMGNVLVPELFSVHEEADTRLFIHVAACVMNGCSRVIIRASDTDIAVIGLYMYQRLFNIGLRELYIQTREYFIPLHEIVEALGPNDCKMMPFLHAVSGCDTNGFFYGKGKSSFLKAAMDPELSSQLGKICNDLEHHDAITDELIQKALKVGTALISAVYKGHTGTDLHTIRCQLYARKADIKLMPPTKNVFKEHILRAMYQTTVWVRSCEKFPNLPDLFSFGWEIADGRVKPVLMKGSPFPESLKKTLFCSCKKGCSWNCPCSKLGASCDTACFCKGLPDSCTRAQLVADNDEPDV